MADSFLEDYCLFNSGNEAAPSYHMWCGISALSSIISRRVWVDQGYFKLFPNLYIVLVGPPGNKKTTALSSAVAMIRTLGDIPLSAECQTKESLVRELTGYTRSFNLPGENNKPPLIYTPLSIMVTELSEFLGPNSGHMINFLTTVWDRDVYDVKTKNKGNDIITGPYITLLACTTPEWITTYLKSDIISGGFSRRAIFVLEYEDGEPIAFPEITEDMRNAWRRAEEHARKLLSTGGPFQWADEAREFYRHWYEEHKLKVKRGMFDITVRGFESTKPGMVLKIAMLLGLSDYGNPSLLMRKDLIETSIAMFDHLGRNLPKVFQGMGRNELNAISAKVCELLEMSGPMPEKKLQGMMYREANGQELYSILTHLVQTDQIVKLAEKDATTGATKKVWVSLKKDIDKVPNLVKQ